MKKLFSAVFFLVGFNVVTCNASCKVDCTSITQTGKTTAEQSIRSTYEQLLNKLDELEDAYDDYQKAVDDQNKLLEQLQALKERNTLLEKEILFFRAADNQVIGLSIDNTATKKGVK